MNIETISQGGTQVAVVTAAEPLITDLQSALDLIATVHFESGCRRIALYKEAVCEDFFELRTGLAGEVLQKFVNYGTKLAVIGDFGRYDSKALRDFIRESNRGRDIFFLATREEAVKKLAEAT